MSDRTVFFRMKQYYKQFTPVEQTIADFFLQPSQEKMFTAKYISKKLHVSEASLSRFAQKMGYHGYREFLYRYEESLADSAVSARKDETGILPGNLVGQDTDFPMQNVYSTYASIIKHSMDSIQPEQLERVCDLLCSSAQVFIYGLGNSGLAATDFELRLLKTGLDIKAVTDYHQMVIHETRIKKDSLTIGITLSAETKEIRDTLLAAAQKGAVTVCITAGVDKPWFRELTEVLSVPTVKGLEYGNLISPMFPLLLELDLLYALYMARQKKHSGETESKPEEEQALWNRLKHYR